MNLEQTIVAALNGQEKVGSGQASAKGRGSGREALVIVWSGLPMLSTACLDQSLATMDLSPGISLANRIERSPLAARALKCNTR